MNAIKAGDKVFLHGPEGLGVSQELGLHEEAGVPCKAKPGWRDQRWHRPRVPHLRPSCAFRRWTQIVSTATV
jgi:hypothetical protein